MNTNLSLQLKLGQQLALTPQLQQAIFLLQLTSVELQQTIQEYVEENPFLETISQTKTTDTPISASEKSTTQTRNFEKSSGGMDDVIARQCAEETLHDHLTWQVNSSHFNELEQTIALTIIDAIDDHGLLNCSLEELQSNFTELDETVDIDMINAIHSQIQRFDPPGVAARDTRESLLIQLQRLPSETLFREQAINIIEQHLDALANHNYALLKKTCQLDEEQLIKTIELIQSLNAHPGRAFGQVNQNYIIPDIIVKKVEGHWIIELNNNILPQLRINQQYTTLIKQSHTADEKEFLQRNLQDARWLLRSISKRNETLINVATYIVNKQQEFLNQGPAHMRPMVIREVAAALDIHDSTVSRVTNGKYITTPQGVFELKYFFSSQLNTSHGENTSATAVRTLIQELIDKEDPKKPLSDQQLLEELKQQGINVARRTIAKYREAMDIPSSTKRKQIKAFHGVK